MHLQQVLVAPVVQKLDQAYGKKSIFPQSYRMMSVSWDREATYELMVEGQWQVLWMVHRAGSGQTLQSPGASL